MSMFDKWIWLTVMSVILIIVVPLVVVWSILNLSPELRIIATIVIIVLWGVASGYKDWVISKGKETQTACG